MSLDSVRCFGCQEFGHLERDCPSKKYAAELNDDKPIWCGQCDKRTRLIIISRDGRDVAIRCGCHPESHLHQAQYRKCAGCSRTVYEWDLHTPCGSHQPVSKPLAASS